MILWCLFQFAIYTMQINKGMIWLLYSIYNQFLLNFYRHVKTFHLNP